MVGGIHQRGAGRSGFASLVAARLVIPGGLVVGLGLGVEAGIQAVVGQLEAVFDEERCVGVVDEILVCDAIVLERVVDDAAEESDVAAGTNLQEKVGLGSGAGKARIDHDDLGVAIALGLDRPLETARMVLSRIAAHDQTSCRCS